MNVSPTDIAGILARLQSQSGGAPSLPPSLPPSLANAIPGLSATGVEAGGFDGVVSRLLSEVNAQQVDADKSIESLAKGETDNVQDVVLTAVKADLSVKMLLEIRNQLVASYQEVMRMQL